MSYFLIFISSFILNAFSQIDANNLPRVEWQLTTTTLNIGTYVYTPFFVDDSNVTLYTGGVGVDPNNGILSLNTDINGKSRFYQKMLIKTGPSAQNYNYFRAPRVARHGNQMWMLAEVSGCYSGCESPQYPNRLAAYYSQDSGQTWTFLNFASVDGNVYRAQWFAHTGLVYNPNGSQNLDLNNPANSRFVTIGENLNMLVSADGVNYKSVKINYPFPKDRLVFASLAKTPFGYHLTSSANWSEVYYTTTVRHLFSKDLINWVAIESNSFMKNPFYYKGVHLSYDEKSNKLWAISPCGSGGACSFMAWIKPKDFLVADSNPQTDYVPNGEYVHINGITAMIIGKTPKAGSYTYKLRFHDGSIDSGYTKEMFSFPLAAYLRQGCEENTKICVGDPVYVYGSLATILGIHKPNSNQTKYAVKFMTGVVDTGYTRNMIVIAQ